ncbi:MAG: dTDP-4-dehydrorhamnose reductase [Xanthomonadales bacterium]|jgi:dTDP-4-dehydrorhamnose reductase|nr:dTDP-4-dehydrorhamnose reductase [Xanthomonadales bacterium]
MKILLTGASGQLGQELLPGLQALGEVTRVDRTIEGRDRKSVEQDLGDLNRAETLLNRLRPDLVVNAAAYTAVDRAEQDSDTAFRINAELPGCLARWLQRNDGLLVHYSTDYVFSGAAARPYREDDPTGPLNVYGESKRAGEWQIAASACRHLLLRTSWVYSAHGNNFVLTMLRLARERNALSIVADQVGCPTWARNLARVTTRMISAVREDAAAARRQGTWHYCDSGAVSWYDFAQAIFAAALSAGLLERLPELTAVPSSGFPQTAERPLYSVLDTSAIRRDFGIEPAALGPSLRACIEEMKKA